MGFSQGFSAGHGLQWFVVPCGALTGVTCTIHHWILCVAFYSICAGHFTEFVSQVLWLSFTASHMVNIAVADRNESVVVVEVFVHYSLQKPIVECWRELHLFE